MRVKIDATRSGAARIARALADRTRRALTSMPKSRLYPALGAILALAAPVGLLVVHAVAAGRVPTLAWALDDLRRLPLTYAYLMIASMVALVTIGRWFGRSLDRAGLLATTDPLTGLFNRRYFGLRLVEEIHRGDRYAHPACLIYVDVDHLKGINDASGHAAGDDALTSVSRSLLGAIRQTDVLARTGGDEFAILLPNSSSAEASVLSQRILAEVARYGDASKRKLSVSIGIAELKAGNEMDALAIADWALYRAKAAGGGHAALATRSESARASVLRGFTLMEAAVALPAGGG